MLTCALLLGQNGEAADKYSSGTKAWDTVTSNWGTSPGVYSGAVWADNDNAFLEGTAGTVSLGQSISINNLTISTASYAVDGGYTLSFGAGGSITNNADSVTYSCGIAGAPSVRVANPSVNNNVIFAPTASNMVLGAVTRPTDTYLTFAGTTTGNVIGSVIKGAQNAKVRFNGTGKWTVGNVYGGYVHIDSGDLVVNGELTSDYRQIEVRNGAVMHWNNPAAVKGPTSGSSSTLRFHIYGGSIDNSSGSAIATSTWDPAQRWAGDWVFVGSLGANSDLNMGAGPVTLTSDVTVTVSNSLATLTVGGAIGDGAVGYDLTKAGAGTLRLTGGGTYVGDTVVLAGTLSLDQVYLGDITSVRLTDGAVLNLDYVGTDEVIGVYTNGLEGPTGTWGALGSGADNETALITGTGMLSVPVPTVVPGVRWWDGGTTNIPSAGNQLSDGGDGSWNTSIKNWDAGAGVSHTNWNNSTNDLAIFKGVAGTVTLAEDISLGHILIDTDGYTIQGNALNFAPAGTITVTVNNVSISSGITGAPDIWPLRDVNDYLTLAPVGTNMTLGTIYRPTDDFVVLSGTTTGNTAVAIPRGQNNQKVHKSGSGAWTINGECYGGEVKVNDGTLICNGRLWETQWDIWINGGTLIANGTMEGSLRFDSGTLGGTAACDLAVSVPAGGTLAPGYPSGTMTVSNNCTIAGVLEINVDGSQHGRLDVDSGYALTISNATLNVNVGASVPATDLVIATYGTLNGEFAATNGIDTWEVDYNYQGGNAIALLPPAAGTVLIIR